MAFFFGYVSNNLLLKSTLFAGRPLGYGFGTRLYPWREDRPLLPDQDGGSAEEAARESFLAGLPPPPAGAAWLRQVHSARIRIATRKGGQVRLEEAWPDEGPAGAEGDGDALITRVPGLLLSVQTADCFPLILFDPQRRQLAVIHAGWRGTLEGIAGRAVQALARHGRSRPADLLAAVGPGVQACCYEVSPELGARFEAVFPGATRPSPAGRPHLSLAECLRRDLEGAGVPPESIDRCGWCTCCHPRLWYSYRREGPSTGRMFTFGMLRKD